VAKDWYTPEELAELQALKPCAPWQRMNPTGWCVERWWAGGPAATLISGISMAAGMAVLGVVIVYVSKIELLKPAIAFVKRSQEQSKMLANRRKWRSGRGWRRRRY
jgi:hypothetical protein